ncbi:MAG: RNA-binding protein [Gammaproteobacteria bacterium]|nr:RNA-binding protein [Gammaproteobacteria bacterium]
MPIGPNGEKRPADAIANAMLVGKLATGDVTEQYVSEGKRKGGMKGGTARAKSLTAERRSEIAREAAKARWK